MYNINLSPDLFVRFMSDIIWRQTYQIISCYDSIVKLNGNYYIDYNLENTLGCTERENDFCTRTTARRAEKLY